MKTTKYILTIALALTCALSSFAITSSYYSSIDGKNGKNLFDAIQTVSKTGYKSLTYDGLWTAYCAIDLNSSGKVWDMYSNATSYTCGGSAQGANYSKEGDSYNREHSIPKSWFGGSESNNTPGTDLFHVVPTDGYVNNMRSAYAFGEVASASYTSKSGCKKGSPKSITISNSILNKSGSSEQSCSASTVFEPMDEYKGDFARGYFGTMIRWANGDYQTFTTAEGAQIFNTSYDAAHYYGLKAYGVALLLKWHREDPVSQKEIDRNNGIQARQGNRNPFIDYPELVEYMWGEHSGETVTLASLTPTFEGYTPPAATTYTVILSRNGQLESITGVSGTYNLPTSSDPACEGWIFAGWSATKVTNMTSTPSTVTSVTSGCTVYAVYSKTSSSSAPKRAKMADTWSKVTDASTLKSSDILVIASCDNGATAGDISNQYMTSVSSTFSSDKSTITSLGSGTVELTLGGTSGAWTLSSTSGALGATAAKKVAWGSGTTTWSISIASGGDATIANGTSSYGSLQYNSGSPRFTTYASSQAAVQLYRKSGGSGSTTYDSEPEDCNCSGNLGKPNVSAEPGDGTITLTWADVTNATNGYTVTVSKGTGYTTECGDMTIGEITHAGTTNTCVISGLINGLEYTTSVVANETATICESVADEDTATPVGCVSWANPTFTYSTPMTAGSGKVTPTIGSGYGTPTFMSSNTSVLQVDGDGKVTPLSAGTATITAHWPGDDTHCPKDVVSNTITVKGTVVLTFNANYEGADPATSTQNFTYGEEQSINANSFSRTGYSFQGWATSPSGSMEYENGASITITAATTLYAVWQVNKHEVKFSPSPSGATVTVNGSSSSPVTDVDFGSTVNIVITPAAHYTLSSVTADGGVTVTGSGDNWHFTMPDKDVKVTVTMAEDTKYTVNWYVNGTPEAEENYAGETLVGIPAPTLDCNGKKFQGWTATENYSSETTAPGDLFTDASTKTMPSNNNTKYYAVFATVTTSGSGTSGWSQVETLDDITDGTYVIENGGYALPSTTTSSAPVKNSDYALTISNKQITSTVSAAMQWTFAMSTGHVATITNAEGRYLYTFSNNNGLRVGSKSDTWTFELNTSAPDFALYDDITGRYCAAYGSGSDWRSYTSATAANYANSGKVHLYKYAAGSTTVITGYTTSCVAPTDVTVTFHANYTGADPATTTQTIPYNTATALTANSFSRTGYTFQGWATSSSGSKEYEDEESVTLTANTHLYAVWQKNSHDVTFTPAPTGATVTINGQSTSPQSVEYGSTVTILITPDDAYTIGSVTATGVEVSGSGNTRTFTMPDADVTVTVTMTPKPTYTIRFFDNGTKISEQNVIDGQSAVKPADPTPCDGYSFVGWWTETLADDNTTVETWVTDFTATQDQDYYAVFSRTESGSGGSGNAVFSATEQGYSNGSSAGTKIIDGVTFAYEDGGNSTNSPKFYTSTNSVHMYPQNTLTISSENNITSIVFTFVRNDGWTANTGTWDDETTWTGDANSIVFTVENTSGFQMRISTITVSIGGGTTYYTTSCAPCLTKVTLTKGDETNGTFTLNKADGEYNNCTTNFVVTVSEITPETGYYCTGVTASGENVDVSGPDGGGNYTVTYTKGNSITSTITANFAPNPKYTVTWSMDGDESNTAEYEEGESIVFLPSATGCEDKTFMGWTATALDAPQDEAPTYVTSATMPAHDVTYYAVYAEEVEGGGSGEITKATSIAVGDIVYLVYEHEEDLYELSGISTGSTKYGIGTSYTTIPNKLYPLEVVEGDETGHVAFMNGSSYLNLSGNSNTLTTATNITANSSWTVTFSDGNAVITNVAFPARTIRWNTSSPRFACYNSGQADVQLYKSSASYTNYTTSCGAGISAKNIGWITAAKGQKVKRVINVYAKGFETETTLTATSGDAQFKVTLGASAVPAGKSGLSTTLTVEYTPTASDNRIEDVEITLSAGGMTKTITVSGRSVPDEFLLITKKNTTWYALPANMSSAPGEYDGVTVVPNNPDGTPTAVAVSPSTVIYSLTSNVASRYADAGNCVHLVGNDNLCLWSNMASTTGKTNIQNKTGASGNALLNNEWLLSTTDGYQYTIANPNHPHYPSRRLAYGSKFGLYEEETVFYIVEAGCSSQPGDVNVSARRAEATFSWESNASSVVIAIYSDENHTSFVKSETATSQPYVMKGLAEETNYWFTLTPDGEDACAVMGSFKTTGPTIDIAEWKEDAVVVQIDHGDVIPSIIIDGQEEHGSITGGGTANKLFFAKYFEGEGSMKLISIFNGTQNNISLGGYKINVITRSYNKGTWNTSESEYDISSLGTIKAGQEIIFFSRPLASETGVYGCANEWLTEQAVKNGPADNPRWIECESGGTYIAKSFSFNGNDALQLIDGSTVIDCFGASDKTIYPTEKNCRNEECWKAKVRNMDYGKDISDFPEEVQANMDLYGIDLINDSIEDLATARSILFRDLSVTSGDDAVTQNTTTFATFSKEWNGRNICGSGTTGKGTCNSFQELAAFDYNDYYIDYTSEVIEEQTLKPSWKDEETNLYTIPIPEMSKYTCLNLRFRLTKEGEVITEVAQQVPILITGDVDTNDELFSELVVDKVDEDDPTTWVPLYPQSKERCSTCDVVVLGTGTLTKGADNDPKDVPEVGNIKIYPGGKLVVPTGTNYSVSSLSFRRQEDNLSMANIQGNLNIKEDGNYVFFDLRVDPSNWHYFALPYDCNVADIRFVNDELKIPVLGTDYLLKYYDGEKRAATQAGGCWEMVEPDATLKKGIGYILGIPGDGKVQREFRFPMSNEIITEEKDPEGKLASGVYAFGGDKTMTEVRANHRGWNLIGNPYLLPYSSDIAEPVMTGYIVPDYSTDPWDGHYKFDEDPTTHTYLRYIVEPVDNGRSEYIQKAITDYEMKPFTSYFVQIGGNNPEDIQGVQFNLSAVERSASPVRRAPASYEEDDTHPVWCAVNITSPKGEKDETTMLISDQFTDGYDMMDDLVKMRGTYYQYAQITTKPVLASRNDEGEMAFNALPDASALAGIPLHYFAATQGKYVIAYDNRYDKDEEVKEVQLFDKTTNEWYDLMNEGYHFFTQKTDNKDRFILSVRVERRKPNTPTDIDASDLHRSNATPRKILINDHVYILRGGAIYDITGKQLLNK